MLVVEYMGLHAAHALLSHWSKSLSQAWLQELHAYANCSCVEPHIEGVFIKHLQCLC